MDSAFWPGLISLTIAILTYISSASRKRVNELEEEIEKEQTKRRILEDRVTKIEMDYEDRLERARSKIKLLEDELDTERTTRITINQQLVEERTARRALERRLST